jgi:hypothetical protein
VAALALASAAIATAGAVASPVSTSDQRDVALAQRVAFRVTDFPTGWYGEPAPSEDSGCFTGPIRASRSTATRMSKAFSAGPRGATSVGLVAVFPTPAIARRAIVAASVPAAFACYGKAVRASAAPAGVKVTGFTGKRVSFDRVGDEVRAYAYAIVARRGQSTGTSYFDLIFVRRGRVVVAANFLQQSSRPSTFIESDALTRAIARAA